MKLTTSCSLLIFAAIMCAGCGPGAMVADKHLETAGRMLARNQVARARAEIERAIEAHPSDVAIYHGAMKLCVMYRCYREAAAVGERLLAQAARGSFVPPLTKRELASLNSSVGGFYSLDRDLANAEKYFRRALELEPENPTYLNDLGYTYADRGVRIREALALTRRAVRMKPDDGAFIDSLGWAEFKAGNNQGAIKHLRRAAQLLSNDATIRYHLGVAYARAGRKQEAWVELKKAFLIDPGLKEAYTEIKKLH